MYGMVFVTLFAVNVALAIYIGTNAKSHAQPWRLFSVGVVAILVAYALGELAQDVDAVGLATSAPSLVHLVQLTNLMLGAMAGALIGAAVSNRTRLMHERELNLLIAAREKHFEESSRLLSELQIVLGRISVDPGDIALSKAEAESLGRLASRALDSKEELDCRISVLSPGK